MKNEDRLSESLEDYLETILTLSENSASGVHPVDIARAKKVSKASVTDTLSKLGARGYITYERYRPVTLTERGAELAKHTLAKHKILVKFLNQTLGIPIETAVESACKMEHAIGRETASKLAELIEEIAAFKRETTAPHPAEDTIRIGKKR